MSGLIIEGVTGTGKTTLKQRLRGHLPHAIFVDEDETLGELFAELANEPVRPEQQIQRLVKVLDSVRAIGNSFAVLERFHHSYFALGIAWHRLDAIDASLAELQFKTVLLDLDDSQLKHRCLHRTDRPKEEWLDVFVAMYGSEEKAIREFEKSQRRRREALDLSRLPSRVIDTSRMEWDEYEADVLSFIAKL